MPWKAHQAKVPVDFLNYMYIDHNHTKQVRNCTDNEESKENIANEVKSKEIWKIRHSEEKSTTLLLARTNNLAYPVDLVLSRSHFTKCND